MIRAVADTHAVIWYIFADIRLSPIASAIIDDAAAQGNQIAFSSMTFIEIVYLSEKGRIHPATFDRLSQAIQQQNAVLVEIPCDRDVAQALRLVDRAQVPDMPNRIIAATALHLGLPLISRDHKIQLSSVPTIW